LIKNKYIFIADVHLGLRFGDYAAREKKFAKFLASLPDDIHSIYFLGDIFDYWYEYKYVIPKGFVRTLGELAKLSDKGVKLYFVPGNHDVWAYGYFEDEIGMKILRGQPHVLNIAGQTFCIGHGDGLGDNNWGYKFLKWMFNNRFLQVCFSAIHPRWSMALGYNWSRSSRLAKTSGDITSPKYLFKGKEEPIYKYVLDFEKKSKVHIDHYIFGHFHVPTSMELPSGSYLHILGEWLNHFDYLVFDGNKIFRKKYE